MVVDQACCAGQNDLKAGLALVKVPARADYLQ